MTLQIWTGQAVVGTDGLWIPARAGRKAVIITNASPQDIEIVGNDDKVLGEGFIILANSTSPLLPYEGDIFILSEKSTGRDLNQPDLNPPDVEASPIGLVSWIEFD